MSLPSMLRGSVATTALLAALGTGVPAQAQGYNWTGFYAGINAGMGWGGLDRSSTLTCPPVDFICSGTIGNAADGAAVVSAASASSSKSGFIGGVQAGYNIQSAGIVLGLEGDAQWLRLKSSRTVVSPYSPGSIIGPHSFTANTEAGTDWLMTLRGRLGFTVTPTMMLYVTGGLALSDIEVSNSFVDVPFGASGSSQSSKTKLGWVFGAGLEAALNRNWSVKAEYLHIDMGSISTSAVINNAFGYTANTLTTKADLSANVVRAGLNYRF